jgi:hypothetical protein
LNPIRTPSIGILVPVSCAAALAAVGFTVVFVSGCCSDRFGSVGFFAFKTTPTSIPTTRITISTAALIPPCTAGLSILFATGALFELRSPNRLVFPEGDAFGDPDTLGLLKVVIDGDDVEEELGVSV